MGGKFNRVLTAKIQIGIGQIKEVSLKAEMRLGNLAKKDQTMIG